MAGQGKTTKSYALQLKCEGWQVLYTCIPNSVHIGVIPIPTAHGASKQRYPDIAAAKDSRILLVEVEMNLTDSVVADIILRFTEMRQALDKPSVYIEWANKVGSLAKLQLPPKPIVETLLVIVNQRSTDLEFFDLLNANGIRVEYLATAPANF